MSQENVEIVAGYARSAARGVDAMAEFWDPDISHRAAEGAIDDAGELHGPEAVRRYYLEPAKALEAVGLGSRLTGLTGLYP